MFVDRHASRNESGFNARRGFRQVGQATGPTVTSDGDPAALTRTNGEEVRLRLPSGFTALGTEDSARA